MGAESCTCCLLIMRLRWLIYQLSKRCGVQRDHALLLTSGGVLGFQPAQLALRVRLSSPEVERCGRQVERYIPTASGSLRSIIKTTSEVLLLAASMAPQHPRV